MNAAESMQVGSKRAEEELLVPSDSPPGFTLIITSSVSCRQNVKEKEECLPDKSIDERIVGGGRRTNAEASSLDVTPLTSISADSVLSIASGIDDKVSGKADVLQVRSEVVGVEIFGVRRVVVVEGLLVGSVVGVVVGRVDGETADLKIWKVNTLGLWMIRFERRTLLPLVASPTTSAKSSAAGWRLPAHPSHPPCPASR